MQAWRTAIEQALDSRRFFVSGQRELQVIHRQQEEIAWEIFLGYLLDESRTRQRRQFEAWDVIVDVSTAPRRGPLLSIKYADDESRLYVVRYLQVYGWQTYESSPGVIESRPGQNQVGELVGTIELHKQADPYALEAELGQYLLLAIVGTSRLPITSLESPLPAFSLGQLMYLPHTTTQRQSLGDPLQLVDLASQSEAPLSQRAKFLDAALRAVDTTDLPELARRLVQRNSKQESASDRVVALLRTMLNDVALSPVTDFVEKLMALLNHLADSQRLGMESVVDVVSYLLRHLTRHLTAYDLKTFHNLGANYPDALLLDAAIKHYLQVIESEPQRFTTLETDHRFDMRRKRLRRRALRQVCLLRTFYEGHAVPDAPTSLGENQRVLPESNMRVPDDQITQPHRRRKQLYADQPFTSLLSDTTRKVLEQSIRDLEDDTELRELGMAIYLDRPLGIFKQQGEVDRTPIVSYEAFSRQIAVARLDQLQHHGLFEDQHWLDRLRQQLAASTVSGYPLSNLSGPQRPGVVALEDARLVAKDFVFLKSSSRSLNEFVSVCNHKLAGAKTDFDQWMRSGKSILLIRTADAQQAARGESFLTAYDRQMLPRFEFSLPAAPCLAYNESGGVEYLRDRMQVIGLS